VHDGPSPRNARYITSSRCITGKRRFKAEKRTLLIRSILIPARPFPGWARRRRLPVSPIVDQPGELFLQSRQPIFHITRSRNWISTSINPDINSFIDPRSNFGISGNLFLNLSYPRLDTLLRPLRSSFKPEIDRSFTLIETTSTFLQIKLKLLGLSLTSLQLQSASLDIFSVVIEL
jgi:hypothetical protein